MKRAALFVVAVAFAAGCATERFGREPTLTPAEVSSLNCQQIDLEIAKVDGFLVDVQRQWENTSGRRFMGFLGDFGIGNHMERRDAIASAELRRSELLNVRAAKQCPGTVPPEPQVD